jgi:hypothetical protein
VVRSRTRRASNLSSRPANCDATASREFRPARQSRSAFSCHGSCRRAARRIEHNLHDLETLYFGRVRRIVVAAAFYCAVALAADPPANLARRVAKREAETEAMRANYMYRQTVVLEDFDQRGLQGGEYREVRDIIFSPAGDRTEKMIGKASDTLKHMKLTDEDFRDLREVQPFLFTPDELWAYETKYRGEETIDDVPCWVLGVHPRQILDGQRLFDGIFWVDQRDFSIVRSAGQAVPQILSTKAEKENLFPHFTTVRAKVGDYWFPIHTHANDTLPFMSGPQRIKLTVRYTDYKKFEAESKIVP